MWIFPTDDRRTDQERWEWLMARLTKDMQRDLFNKAYGLLGNRDDAADVYHDTLMKAAAECHKLRDEDRLYPWVAKILENNAKRYYAINRMRTVLMDIPRVMNIRDRHAGAEARMIRREKREWVRREIEKLEYPDDVIFRRHVFDEETFDVIAQELDVNANTVRSRYRRIVERLGRKAREEYDEENEQ